MAAGSGVVGVLRALLTADTAQFDTAMRKAVGTTESTTKSISGLTREVGKLTPQAERMVRAFGGDRLFTSANNLATAITKIGGATKLTSAEQARANATLTAAVEKYRALGLQAPRAILDAEKATSSLSGQVKAFVGGLGPLGPAIAAAFSASAVIGFVKTVSDAADSLVKLHDKTQISLQGLQRLQIAGDDAGNSLEDLTGAITQMQVRLGNAKPGDAFDKALHNIGLTIGELQAMNPEGQFMAISDGLRGIPDPALRASTAVALGGRQMANALPTLARGFDDLRGRTVGMSDDTIHALDEAGDAWKKLERISLDFIGAIAAKSLDLMFPIKAAVRQEQALLDQLDAQAKAAQGRLPGILGPKPLDIQTMSLEEADRISKELDEKTKDLIAHELELARVMAQAFGLDKVANAKQLLVAIGGMPGMVHMDAEALKSLNKLMDEAIGAAKRNGQEVPLEWFRILEATRDNVGSLQEYLKTVQQLPEAMREIPEPPQLIPFTSELDIERTRKLLIQNAPGSALHHAATQVGETLGHQINQGIARAFEQIPHFLTSSIIHSGSFINGLKAIGVDMADAIVEPLIKRFVAKITAARLLGGIGGAAATAGSVAASAATTAAAAGGTSFVASEVAGTAAAASGGTAAGGAGAALAAFATNPFTIAAAAGIAGVLLFRHFHNSANDIRNKDLAQFSGFDTAADRADTANPPGFHGLFRLLTKYSKGALFGPFVTAHDTSGVRRNFAPIQAVLGTLGRSVRSFQMGGFVPPGVTQPAILHGGAFGEDINPRGPDGPGGGGVSFYVSIHAWDGQDVDRVFQSQILPRLSKAVQRNHGYITTDIRRSL